MAQLHGGQIVARALAKEGVQFVFTLCGGHIMSIYDGCIDEGIRVIDVRHEQTAAHAADGWGRITGQPGVALVTAGPGLTDAVTGVATAHRAKAPMVIIGGQAPRAYQDMGGLQDMNHVELMRPITKWSVAVPDSRRLGEYVSTAFRIATTNVPGPVFLEMPLDFLFDNVDEDRVISPTKYRTEAGLAGDPAYIDQAFEVIRNAERPVCLVGSQYWWSRRRAAYLPFLETFGMPTFVNGMARGSIPPGHPYGMSMARKDALRKADCVLIFGTPLDFRIGYGRSTHIAEDAKIIQVDLEGGEIGRNRAIEVGIIGDTGLVMEQLTQAAKTSGYQKNLHKAWTDDIRRIDVEKRAAHDPEMTSNASPVNPVRACAEIDAVLNEDSIVIGDGGDFVGTAANVLRIHKPGHWLDAGPLGTLGAGPGFAMAAKLAKPKSDVIIVYGDGSFGLNGFEFEAMARQKINVVGVIGNDAAWQQIKRGQVQLYGADRAIACSLDFTRYDQVGEALGCHGEYVEKPEEVRPALQRALKANKPAIVNIKIGASEFRKDAISV
ncbi:MAG: acetolactate synthase [Deltaproteobacteria bacterium]|nr:acetolactate synthase [Deltaproteobacteria bacterium]